MSFTKKQMLKHYIPLVNEAWLTYCDRNDVEPNGKGVTARKDAWYRAVLHEKLGVYSSKQLHPVKHFARACAVFEEIVGKSIHWQLKVDTEGIERARYALDQLVREHDIDQDYLRGASVQMFDTRPENLNAKQLGQLIAALKIHFKRQEAA